MGEDEMVGRRGVRPSGSEGYSQLVVVGVGVVVRRWSVGVGGVEREGRGGREGRRQREERGEGREWLDEAPRRRERKEEPGSRESREPDRRE